MAWRVYVAGGTTGLDLETAQRNFWSLDLSRRNGDGHFQWQQLPAWQGPERAFAIAVAQHNATNDCVYVISGRRNSEDAAKLDPNGPGAFPRPQHSLEGLTIHS